MTSCRVAAAREATVPAAHVRSPAGRVFSRVGVALSPLLMSGHSPTLNRRTLDSIFASALERGIDLFDPGLVAPAASQCLVARATAGWKTHPFVISRVGLQRVGTSMFRSSTGKAALVAECDASLRRLRRDALDLALLDAADLRVPLEESIGTLDDLKQQGKIREIGLSHPTLAELDRARATTRIAAVECFFDPITRPNAPLLAACDARGIMLLPRMPFDLGELVSRASALRRVAAEHRVTPSEVAAAWLLRLSARTLVVSEARGGGDVARLARTQRIALASVDLEELADAEACR